MDLVEIKTSELIGPALDWAVRQAVGPKMRDYVEARDNFSTCWNKGGPLIDKMGGFELKVWLESKPETKCEAHIHNYDGNWVVFGPTPLIAAMRCLVASKLGDTVQIPSELIQ